MVRQLCIDVGGTFTDCLVTDETHGLGKFKAPTTPLDPSRGFFDAVAKAAEAHGQSLGEFLAGVDRIVHGTTLGTNLLIGGRGAKVGMITTQGFRDVIEIRRGIKNLHGSMFDQFIEPYRPLVPRHLRLGVPERTLYTGEILTPLGEDDVRQAVRYLVSERCTAIAVCFLHSYTNPAHERRAREIVAEVAPEVYVAASHEILPIWREFERFSTTVVSAFIGPALARYLLALQDALRHRGFVGSLLMMLSNGLVQTVDGCVDRAVYLLGSGPAAAPSAGRHLGAIHGRTDLLSVDMGGTSFDICMIKNGEVPTTSEGWVGEERVAIKMVDISSIGAGGGSIAWIDSLGLLRVGPQSAGAAPGPAAYGRGEEATVTDADLVLGYIPSDYFLGGEIHLDIGRSRDALGRVGRRLGLSVEEGAQAIFTLITAVMADQITEMCTKKGHDIRDFTMVAGGGAGGVHAAAIAARLSIPEVIIPRVSALMSAFGMLTMPLGREYARTRLRTQAELDVGQLRFLYEEMREEARGDFARMGIPAGRLLEAPTVEMRYVGQFHEVEIDLPSGEFTAGWVEQLIQAFHRRYEQLYTYSMPWLAVEFLTFRLRVHVDQRPIQLAPLLSGALDAETARRGRRRCLFDDGELDTPAYDWVRLAPGHRIRGPAVIDDPTTTVLIPPGFSCAVDDFGNLILRSADRVASLQAESARAGRRPARGGR